MIIDKPTTLRPFEAQWLYGISAKVERRRRFASDNPVRFRRDYTEEENTYIAKNLDLTDA